MSGWRKRQIEELMYKSGLVAEGVDQQLTTKITETFGLLKASEHMSDKGYQIGNKVDYQKFVEKRNGKV